MRYGLWWFFVSVSLVSCNRTENTPVSATSHPAPAVTSRPTARFGLHLTRETSEPGYHVAKVQFNGDEVYIADTPLFTGADVQDVTRETDESVGMCIDVTFEPVAAARLAAETRARVGQRLAIVVDGRVILAPRIEAEVPEGRLQLSGGFSAREWQEIFDAIRAR